MDKRELTLHLLEAEWLPTYVTQTIPARYMSALEPDDVLQGIYIAAFASVSAFVEIGPDAFQRWLKSIAQRKLIDAIRIAKAVKRGGRLRPALMPDGQESSGADLFHKLISPAETPSGVAAAVEAAKAVNIALAALHPDRRQAVHLRFFEDRSLKQIAAVMGKSNAAVRSLLYRALQDLRGLLLPAFRELNERQRRAAARDD